MSRAENIHYRYKDKKHPASRCKKPRCGICRPNKAIGGNNKAAIKPKYHQRPLDHES